MKRLLPLFIFVMFFSLNVSANVKYSYWGGTGDLTNGITCPVGTVTNTPLDFYSACIQQSWFGAQTNYCRVKWEVNSITAQSSTTITFSENTYGYVWTDPSCPLSGNNSIGYFNNSLQFITTTDPVTQCVPPQTLQNGVCALPPTTTTDSYCSTTAKVGQFGGSGTMPTGTICAAAPSGSGYTGGCNYSLTNVTEVTLGGNTSWAANGTPTGTSCTAVTSGTTTATTDATNTVNCITGADGRQVCASSTLNQQNCGTYNGETVCVQSIPSNTCQSTASGAIFCTGTAKPPLNSNGALPTASATVTENINNTSYSATYYNSNVTSNTYNPDTAATAQYAQQTAKAAQQTNTDLQATNQKLDDIKAGQCGAPGQPKCQMDLGAPGPGPGQVDDISTTTDGAMARIKNAPIVQAITGIGLTGSGLCPTATFQIFNATFVMDAHCIIGEQIRGLLSYAVIAGWALLGALIIMSA